MQPCRLLDEDMLANLTDAEGDSLSIVSQLDGRSGVIESDNQGNYHPAPAGKITPVMFKLGL
ncbi:hypothetical protein O9993_21695 [Vibrio lentus]|nr:hypothetical protein [Vibrio lentus]